MCNSISPVVLINFVILCSLTYIGWSAFVPRPEKVHFGHVTYPRRWGRWCTEDSECGTGFCWAYMCQCYSGYITWDFMETCAYQQRKKSTAFFVSFFVGTFGVDWFVLSRGNAGYIIAGIIKMIISLGCCIGWPFVFFSRQRKFGQYVVLGSFISAILTTAALIWWLIDWIRILADAFYDGNGVPLQPWGQDNYRNRIPFFV